MHLAVRNAHNCHCNYASFGNGNGNGNGVTVTKQVELYPPRTVGKVLGTKNRRWDKMIASFILEVAHQRIVCKIDRVTFALSTLNSSTN